MLRLIPAPLHRLFYRVAHRARIALWQITNPEVSGCLIVGHDLDNKVLLLRLSYGADTWQLPGGGIHKGEEPEVAARREMMEETGCTLPSMQLVGETKDETLGAKVHTHIFAGVLEDMPKVDNREVVEARFFPVHSLPEPLSERTRAALKSWTEGRR